MKLTLLTPKETKERISDWSGDGNPMVTFVNTFPQTFETDSVDDIDNILREESEKWYRIRDPNFPFDFGANGSEVLDPNGEANSPVVTRGGIVKFTIPFQYCETDGGDGEETLTTTANGMMYQTQEGALVLAIMLANISVVKS